MAHAPTCGAAHERLRSERAVLYEGSSQNNLWLAFLGDYVYAIATDTYGAAVWNDVRNAADCPAIDTWRVAAQQAIQSGGTVPTTAPAPQQACPANFGNSDIFGGSFPDLTP